MVEGISRDEKEAFGGVRLTDEVIDKYAKERTGSYAKTTQGHVEVTVESTRHFVEGIGDTNPLWVDEEYAKKSRWGGIIAPPSYPYGVLCGVMQGMPGVHAYHSGDDWTFYKPIRLGDLITGTFRLRYLIPKESKFAGRTIIERGELKYYNRLDELVCETLHLVIRAERQASRERGKYKALEPYMYTYEEIEAICQAYENEQIRGATPRYWEDVNIGDEIPPIIRGPYTSMEMNAYNEHYGRYAYGIGVGGGIRVRELLKHPSFTYRDPESGALQSIAEVHTMTSASRGAAIPTAYDLGAQRNCWYAIPLTHWMGNDGFLKRLYAEYRRFNMYGDTLWIAGKVTKKYVEKGEYLVDIEMRADNQRGENTTPGWATVILPTRSKLI